jgi:hypothetical protein
MNKLIVALLTLFPIVPAVASPQEDAVAALKSDLLAGHIASLSVYLLPENHTPGVPISADDVRSAPAQTCTVPVTRDLQRSLAIALGGSDFRFGDYAVPTHTVIRFLDGDGKVSAEIGLSTAWNQRSYNDPVYIASVNGGSAMVNGTLPKWIDARVSGWGCERRAGYMFRY